MFQRNMPSNKFGLYNCATRYRLLTMFQRNMPSNNTAFVRAAEQLDINNNDSITETKKVKENLPYPSELLTMFQRNMPSNMYYRNKKGCGTSASSC